MPWCGRNHGQYREVAVLFIAQRKDGTRAGDTQRVRKNRDPGDRQRGGAGGQKIERIERNSVGVTLEPMVEIIISDGPGDRIGNQHRDGELPKQEPYDVTCARPEYFADADLLGAALGGERGNAEEAETGDQNGNPDEKADHPTLL